MNASQNGTLKAGGRNGAIAAAALIFVLGTVVLVTRADKPRTPSAKDDEQTFLDTYCKTNTIRTTVPSGSDAQARSYYASLESAIGFRVQEPSTNPPAPGTTLEDLFVYLGYGPRAGASALTAKELQDSAPDDLMDGSKLGQRLGGLKVFAGDVLVARFFAPKISNVGGSGILEGGWRKLVRLRAQPGSAAVTHGVDYGVVLFNFFSPIGTRDPFAGNDSQNTQVILVSGDVHASLHWLDFGKTSDGAHLNNALNAFFDAGHTPSNTAAGGGAASYFVPCSCVACHGGLRLDFNQTPPAPDPHFRAPVLDYLDTDHWTDRTGHDDDFEKLGAPVLFDAGTFGVTLEINQEIVRQNAAAQPDNVLLRGAEHWLTWHLIHGSEKDDAFDRSLTEPTGSPKWDPLDPVDAELLPKLNRYCFRCHGSVKFDVFDKGMVRAMRTLIISSLFPRSEIGDPRAAMPPDRDLSADELTHLRDLIGKMK